MRAPRCSRIPPTSFSYPSPRRCLPARPVASRAGRRGPRQRPSGDTTVNRRDDEPQSDPGSYESRELPTTTPAKTPSTTTTSTAPRPLFVHGSQDWVEHYRTRLSNVFGVVPAIAEPLRSFEKLKDLVLEARTGKGEVPPDARDPRRYPTRKQRGNIFDRQGGKCAECGIPLKSPWQAHHRKRHADGGLTEDENLAGLCGPCHKGQHSGL